MCEAINNYYFTLVSIFLSSRKRIFHDPSSRTHSRSFVKDYKCYVQGAILFSKLTTSVAPVHPYHGGISLLCRGYRLSLGEGWILLSLRRWFWQQARRKFGR